MYDAPVRHTPEKPANLVPTLLLGQIRHFWEAQEGILKETEAISKRWFNRRHDAVRTALQAMEQVSREPADFAAASSAIRDWQAGSLERIADDFSDCFALWRQAAALSAENEIAAEQEALQATGAGKGASESMPI